MNQQRRSERSPSRRFWKYKQPKGWQTMWIWSSQRTLFQQRVWLGWRESDRRQPPWHYNLHVQPVYANMDYHNYHIRYLGIRDGEYVWSVVDAPAGMEKSNRVYSFSKRGYIRDVVELASSLLVTDILDDVGDASLWLQLAESLALVLFDLYRHDLEMTS